MTKAELDVSAVESVISCLLEMAAAETNPVLHVIDSELPLEENKKYPANLLQFKGLGWRAYYHCHPSSRAGNHRFKGEHGHFHIFVRIEDNPEKWSHLVALAMDNMGQPLGLFTVNHWVTGEEWESAHQLIMHLKNIPYIEQDNVVERWLLSLLDLCGNLIETILDERDKVIDLKQSKAKEADIKADRNLYLLSEIKLDLKALFERNGYV